jgi:hypothetical protein
MRVAGGGWVWTGFGLRRMLGVWMAVALAVALSPGSALATAPGTNGPIAFSSYGKIYAIQPDGSGLHPVPLPDGLYTEDFYPSWAPDGLRIVTSGEMQEPDGYWTDMGLQVFSPDGTGFEHLPIFGYVGAPAWSPDGAHILFAREGELFSTTPDGSLPIPLESKVGGPAWSPDGTRIAFVRSVGSEGDIALFTMSASGGDARELLELPGQIRSPSWSPDGTTIAFTYDAREPRDDPGPGEPPYVYAGDDIYTVPAAGGNPEQLTSAGTDQDPAWSPDGSMIVFQSERNTATGPDLYLMNANGSEQRRLTTTIHCLQCGPDWASLPPHPHASALVLGGQGEGPRWQRFSHLALTRTRFAGPSRVWVRFRAAIAEKVDFTILRTVPPKRAFRCGTEPSVCDLTGQDGRQAREGLNRISLSGLLGGALAPGRYWLQLSSSSDRAHTGLAFTVTRSRDRRRGGRGR